MSGHHVLQSILTIQQSAFPAVLQSLLEEHQGNKAALYEFLLEQGYAIEKTSMYRYFNATRGVQRLPDAAFLRLFAAYTGMNADQEAALIALWQWKRRRAA